MPTIGDIDLTVTPLPHVVRATEATSDCRPAALGASGSAFRPLIQALLFPCRPSAVLRRVITIVVDAVKRAPEWARPHVSEKRREIIRPLFTHTDASPPVSRIRRVPRITASLLRSMPTGVLRARSSRQGVPVAKRQLRAPFAHVASTGLRVSSSERRQIVRVDGTACTTTEHAPLLPAIQSGRISHDCQSAIGMTDDIQTGCVLVRHSAIISRFHISYA